MSLRTQSYLSIWLFTVFHSHCFSPILKMAKYRINFFCHIPKFSRLLIPTFSPCSTSLGASRCLLAIPQSLALNNSRFIVCFDYRLNSTDIMPRNLSLLDDELIICSSGQLITENLLRAGECQKKKQRNNHWF